MGKVVYPKWDKPKLPEYQHVENSELPYTRKEYNTKGDAEFARVMEAWGMGSKMVWR